MHTKKVVLIFTMFFFVLMGEEVMKITLTSNVAEEKLSKISKIVFSENKMVAGSSYNLSEIKKITFYNDDTVGVVGDSSKFNLKNSLLKKGQIGFHVTKNLLSLTLQNKYNLSVSLYSVNGRKVAKLFSGNAEVGVLNLNLSSYSLATGIYSVLVKADSVIFVRKLIIK